MQPHTTTARVSALLASLALAVSLTACTGSSSTTASPDASTGPRPSRTGPAVAPHVPTANPIAYRKVTKAEAKQAERVVVRAPGVQNVAFVPPSKLLVYFTRTATTAERGVADRLVKQELMAHRSRDQRKKKHRHKH